MPASHRKVHYPYNLTRDPYTGESIIYRDNEDPDEIISRRKRRREELSLMNATVTP